MEDMIPQEMKGPKLGPFRGNIDNIEFIKMLGPDERKLEEGDVPHARVFLVRINGRKYVIKIFNFFSIVDLRPFPYGAEELLTNRVVRYQMDPFYAECRAFGLLVEKKQDDLLAVRCHGYAFLPAAIEHLIEARFGNKFAIKDWNREPSDKGSPLRAIIKDYIPSKSPYGRRKLSVIKSNIEKMNELGIFNMDICRRNLLGGRLFDFSIAITSPHIHLSTRLRETESIDVTVGYDRACFREMEEHELKRRASSRAAYRAKLRRGSCE
ncbi:kinetochore Sim4 complex subunit FTA2-domain-containing protein [Xylaria bambusicola]|uniref:kinetochore Sim4 complex subunit FTA2-domain-containing protein n=1 Tax=Xylaria bambusicola TaxID=326684 RepID=UPI0020073D30|nr:kinetochore Sim4 complex subunit FTA2-domain-containing protein [Xylaria bambusicola]KAI0509720.1 kinetochore Sim4 complex subunit FTA2-domain-containing protein [Xylaria bambusicola]